MKFVDNVRVLVEAGAGGSGCCSFRREKFVPRGGPDGGDGGPGGDIILEVDGGLGTLLDLQFHQHVRAKRGVHGKGKDMTGAGGEGRVMRIPPGCEVFDDDTGELMGELTVEGQRLMVAKGGRGGRGNTRFATSTNRIPHRSDSGEEGESRWIRIELKLMADVGLVGYPNVGKSTLVSAISRAKPKIADYPFTTLIPHLGVVKVGEYGSFVIADVPGLIDGAAEGAGLGHRFLRHIERCSILLHLLEVNDEERDGDPIADLDNLTAELARYAPELAERPAMVALNKMELNPDPEIVSDLKAEVEKRGMKFVAISAAAHMNLDVLKKTLAEHIPRLSAQEEY